MGGSPGWEIGEKIGKNINIQPTPRHGEPNSY